MWSKAFCNILLENEGNYYHGNPSYSTTLTSISGKYQVFCIIPISSILYNSHSYLNAKKDLTKNTNLMFILYGDCYFTNIFVMLWRWHICFLNRFLSNQECLLQTILQFRLYFLTFNLISVATNPIYMLRNINYFSENRNFLDDFLNS